MGKHSADAALLLVELFPDISRDAIIYMLRHDLGERWVGDMPCTAGWDNGELGRAYKAAEAAALAEHRIVLPELSPEEAHLVAVVDKLELWMWCEDQRELGNCQVDGCRRRLNAYFEGLEAVGRLPAEVFRVFQSNSQRTS